MGVMLLVAILLLLGLDFFFLDPLDFKWALAVAATAAATISLISFWRSKSVLGRVGESAAANDPDPPSTRGEDGGEGECARCGRVGWATRAAAAAAAAAARCLSSGVILADDDENEASL
jgi:hypothetical protein